jgi:hypothetical protein
MSSQYSMCLSPLPTGIRRTWSNFILCIIHLTSYDRALLTTELEDIFANAPPSPAAAAPDRVRAAYAKATGKVSTADLPDDSDNKRMPTKEDDCPVCYEGMHGSTASQLVWCDGCGNALHKECFQQCEFMFQCT